MEKVRSSLSSFKTDLITKIKKLIDNKKALDFLVAALTIPVLLTVILSNYYSLQSRKLEQQNAIKNSTPSPIEIKLNISPAASSPAPTSGTLVVTATPTPAACLMDPAPAEITYPSEGSSVSDDPVCVDLSIEQGKYCDSEWAYRVNNAGWSDYTTAQICLYNMKTGNVKLDVRVRNKESQRSKIYTRNFNYQGNEPTATPSPTFTPAPTLTPAVTP